MAEKTNERTWSPHPDSSLAQPLDLVEVDDVPDVPTDGPGMTPAEIHEFLNRPIRPEATRG